MKGTVLRKPSAKAAPYWGMLQGLSKPLKLELVVLLSESMEEREVAPTPPPPPLSEEERKAGLMRLAGCWADDPEDAARMEAAIKECRENDVLREVKHGLTAMEKYILDTNTWIEHFHQRSGVTQHIM